MNNMLMNHKNYVKKVKNENHSANWKNNGAICV